MLTTFFNSVFLRPSLLTSSVVGNQSFLHSLKLGVNSGVQKNSSRIFYNLANTSPSIDTLRSRVKRTTWNKAFIPPLVQTKFLSFQYFGSPAPNLQTGLIDWRNIRHRGDQEQTKFNYNDIEKLINQCVASPTETKVILSDPWFSDSLHTHDSTNKGIRISVQGLADNLPELCKLLLQFYPTSSKKLTVVLFDDLIRKMTDHNLDVGLSRASAFTSCMKIVGIFGECSVQLIEMWDEEQPMGELDYFRIPFVSFFNPKKIPEISRKLREAYQLNSLPERASHPAPTHFN